MDVPTALLTHLTQLGSSVGLDGEVLQAPLTSLAAELRTAVPSYRGLQVTIVDSGQPVALTDLLRFDGDGAVGTSLRVPLPLLGHAYEGGSRVVFYGGTAGAFVDLAADLGHVLKTSTIILDVDLPRTPPISGLTGLAELSAINRALGIMIDRGYQPDHAHETLRQGATAAGVETHIFAARMLGR